ncbi:hypothetical protein BDB01DRAFT_780057 [Pilobolus umbonatus]|nr:hypothetical protein BDB01DRAFT_780057 [Pilobolus umbonatus]
MHRKRTKEEDFITTANEKTVSIIAREIGFGGIKPLALESLTELLGTYIEKMFTRAHLYAELGNRSRPNIYDITRSVEDTGIQISTFENYLKENLHDTKSINMTRKYLKTAKSKVSTVEEIPEFLPSDNEDSEEEMDEHINPNGVPTYVPPYFPTFPSKHSFRQTPIYIQRPDDPQRVRELNSEQSRTVEENLKKLMSAENQLLKQTSAEEDTLVTQNNSNIIMPIVNYEAFIQKRKKSKQSGITLDVEGSNEPKITQPDLMEEVKEMEDSLVDDNTVSF